MEIYLDLSYSGIESFSAHFNLNLFKILSLILYLQLLPWITAREEEEVEASAVIRSAGQVMMNKSKFVNVYNLIFSFFAKF